MVCGNLISISQFNVIPEPWLKYFYFWNYFVKKEEAGTDRKLEGIVYEEPLSSLVKTAVMPHDTTNLSQIGYESTKLVDNLSTLLVLMETYSLMFFALFLLKFLSSRCERVKIYHRKLREILLWNLILRFLLEGYLEMSIDCLISLKHEILYKQETEDEEEFPWIHAVFSNVFTVVLYLLLLGYPFIVLYIINQHGEDRLIND